MRWIISILLLWVLIGRIIVSDMDPLLSDDISAFIIVVMLLHKFNHWVIKVSLIITLSLIYTSIANMLGFSYPDLFATFFSLITGVIAFTPIKLWSNYPAN